METLLQIGETSLGFYQDPRQTEIESMDSPLDLTIRIIYAIVKGGREDPTHLIHDGCHCVIRLM